MNTVIYIYLFGMILIGLPLGRYTLKIWKDPENFPQASRFFFPLSSESVYEVGSNSSLGNITLFLLNHNVHCELKSGHLSFHSGIYILKVMLLWPILCVYLLFLPSIRLLAKFLTFGI
jgi:hypothetical protein